jgi:hypothetical protein
MTTPTQTQAQDKTYGAVTCMLCNHQNFIAILEPQEVERLFALFQDGSLPAVIGDHNLKSAPGPSWRIKSSEIISIRILTAQEVEALKQQLGVQSVVPTQQKSAVTPGQFPALSRTDLSGFTRPFGN